jgi:glycosyltransferase involved in cell wall biosynthesis
MYIFHHGPHAAPGNHPLNVLVIGSTYPRHEDDYAVPWLREAVRRLTGRGHKVTVLAPSYRGLADHTLDGVPIRRFRYFPKRWEALTHEEGAPNRIRNRWLQLLGAPYVVMGSLAAARLAARDRFDLIHSHWPFPHGALAAAAQLACGAPVVTTNYGAEFALARRTPWVRPLLRQALRASDALVSISTYTAAEVRAVSGLGSRVIPYGITVEARPTPPPCSPVPKILFTGRLIQRKGVRYLIEAMPQILARRPAILQITGDGDQRGDLERLTRSLGLGAAVEFHGFVSNRRLDELYAGCDVYVNPSVVDDCGDTEGLGVGPIEALAHGRPVIASAVGGILDVIKHRETGLLVPQKDPCGLALGLLELLDNPELARSLARTGLDFVQRHFHWDLITDAIEDVYHDAIAAYRRPAVTAIPGAEARRSSGWAN